MAPEVTGHILVSPAFLFPFQSCVRIQFEISFHPLTGAGSIVFWALTLHDVYPQRYLVMGFARYSCWCPIRRPWCFWYLYHSQQPTFQLYSCLLCLLKHTNRSAKISSHKATLPSLRYLKKGLIYELLYFLLDALVITLLWFSQTRMLRFRWFLATCGIGRWLLEAESKRTCTHIPSEMTITATSGLSVTAT